MDISRVNNTSNSQAGIPVQGLELDLTKQLNFENQLSSAGNEMELLESGDAREAKKKNRCGTI